MRMRDRVRVVCDGMPTVGSDAHARDCPTNCV
jgi:hypothetical protein